MSITPKPRATLFIGGIVFLSSLGLVFGLMRSGKSLTIDEPTTANIVHARLPEALNLIQANNDPVLHPLLLKLWTAAFGEGEIGLRSFSVVCFALTILIVGLTARRLKDRRAGLIAAALALVSIKTGLTFAATARAYALLSLWAACAAFLAFDLLELYADREARPSPAHMWTFAGLLALVDLLGLLTHPLYVFIIAACTLIALFLGRKKFLQMALIDALALGLYLLVWGATLRSQAGAGFPATAWMVPPRLRGLALAYLNLWGDRKTLIIAAAALLAFVGAAVRSRSWRPTRAEAAGLGMLAAAGLGPFVFSHLILPVFHSARTPTLFLPAACVFLALLLARPEGRRANLVLAGFFGLLIVDVAVNTWQYMNAPETDSARASVRLVLDRSQCGDVWIAGGESFSEVSYYVRRFEAQDCVQVTGFPAQIEQHPGWLDIEALLGEGSGLDAEAARRAAALTALPPGTGVWFFFSVGDTYGHAEIDQALRARLDELLAPGETLDLGGSFFDGVAAYRVATP